MPKYRKRRTEATAGEPVLPFGKRKLGATGRNERLMWEKFWQMCVYVIVSLLLVVFSLDHKPRMAYHLSSSVINIVVDSTYTNGAKLLKVCWCFYHFFLIIQVLVNRALEPHWTVVLFALFFQ